MAAPTISEAKHQTDQAVVRTRYLLVVGPNLTATHKLPAEGTVVIGRGEDAPIRLIDPQASRSHACLHLGDKVELEDLGSANGTRLREQALPAFRLLLLNPGDAFTIGDTVLMLQTRDPGTKPRKLWSHAYFESRLIEECARAESVRGAFAVARLHIDGNVASERVTDVLGESLRSGDVLAAYGPNEYEMLLPDTGGPKVEALCAKGVAALKAAGLAVQCGLAIYPADGTSPQALVSRACAKVMGAPATAGTRSMVLRNQGMRELHAMAERVAAGHINVLILGETGAGKELMAETIHRRSPRAGKPFVAINCAAMTEALLDSELFGHEKGAFSGAVGQKMGLLEAADGGTVFLDEVGEMTPGMQAKLLRAIEAKEVRPVGGTRMRPVDVRFVAATNRDLEEEVAEKRFREDLYFRLNGMSLQVLPLRERIDEIEPLARTFLETAARQMGRLVPRITDGALAWLRAYAWPGNIRELRNVMDRALLLCGGEAILVEHLPTERMSPAPAAARGGGTPSPMPVAAVAGDVAGGPDGRSWRERVAAGERQAIIDALERCAGNQTRAAELLGMPRRTFCARMKEYAIPGPRG